MSGQEYQIFVENVILHILDTNLGAAVLSGKEIEPGEEGYGFVERILPKILNDDHMKNATFVEGPNRVKELCEGLKRDEAEVLGVSRELAGKLYEIMAHHPDIPMADLVCCRARIDDTPHLVLLKLNYRSGYIHFVQYDGEAQVNTIIKQKTVLPGENQRVDEAVLINLDDMGIRLLEKEYELDGNKAFYLSQKFLGCHDQLSAAQKAKVISKAVETVSKKYSDENFENVARLRKTVAETISEDTRAVNIEGVAREIFQGHPVAQQEYIEEVRKGGIRENEVQLSERIAERNFTNHKIKTDTGIEILFPATYFSNHEMIEFINNPNGTISILIKNVGKITNK